MSDLLSGARKRQSQPQGVKPKTTAAAIALAKSQAYQDAADAPGTLKAYASDVAHFEAWCKAQGFAAEPDPTVVGAYLAAAGEGYAPSTLRRRVAAIARASGMAGHPLDTKHPAIRETLRGIGRRHGARARRSAALTTAEIRRICAACDQSLSGIRDRALILLGFAGAFRRSELVSLNVEHIDWTRDGMTIFIERSKTDKAGEGAEIAIPHGRSEETCAVTALRTWLQASKNSPRPPVSQNQQGRPDRTPPARRRRGAVHPSNESETSRPSRQMAGADQPAQPACRFRDHRLWQWRAR